MPTSIETRDRTAGNPDRLDHGGGGVFSILGVDLIALLAALLVVLIAVSAFPSQQSVASLAAYLPLHAVVQMLAITVSILVFAAGWVAYSRERVGNSVLLSCAFLAVGLMDFAYTMAFPGMPDFVTPSSEGKAIDFWLAARALAAGTLLFAALRPWRPFASTLTRYWLLFAALGITALVYWLILYFESALPATFVPGEGPTAFKTAAEYTLIAVYVLAAAVFLVRLRIERADYLRSLFTACCVFMLSELFFTFYGDVTDINNLPGHLYNLIAYLLIYQALAVSGNLEPYQRLQQSRQPRRANLERRRRGLASDWWRVGLSPDWYREQDGAAAQAMLAAIVENSNTAIIGCARDGTILSWNAAAERMFGWPAREAIGQPVAIITPQQHHGLLQPLFDQAARGEPVEQIESRHLRRDGTGINTAGTLVAIRDANGETVFFTLTLWDITRQKQLESERKRAEEQILKLNAELEQRVADRTRQLEATNKELEAFSYSVSHDLRAPLRGIDGFSQMLLQKYAGQLDATGSDYLQRIRRASLRMGELIDDLLQLARLSRSQIKIQPLDVSGLARSILAALREREPERKVATEVQDGIALKADSHLLKIALENLLGNAWKFTSKQPAATIQIGAKVQDGEPVVFIKDNGAGFDMKFANKLFGAFQRLHGAAEFEGTGIGLATVQRIVNLHGGRIWADSAVGSGATFYFSLPSYVSDAMTPPAGEAA